MECPRDQHALVVRHHENCAYEGCLACGGHFLEPGLLRQTLGLDGHDSAEQIRDSTLPVGPLRCPADQTPMRILIHDGIEIDLCPCCGGVWLDPGELDAIAARRRPNRNNDDDTLEDAGGVDVGLDSLRIPTAGPVDASAEAGSLVGELVDFVGSALGSLFDGL